jgi:hypothetical protein
MGAFQGEGIENGLMGMGRHGAVSLPSDKKRRTGMKNTVHSSFVAGLCVAALLVGVSAQAAGESKGEARFAIGLTYAAGFTDVSDAIENYFEVNGYDIDSVAIPVGLSVVGGYRFASGIEVLLDAGPFTYMYVDAVGGSLSGEYTYWDIPVGLTAGYAFFTESAVSPYVRGGVRHHFAGGDFYDSTSPGFYVAGGVNFFSNKAVNLQLEVAYDAATVTYVFGKVQDEIEPGGLLVSVRAAF